MRGLEEKHFQERTVEPQISPLRFASVEMTKGGVVVDRSSGQEKRSAHPAELVVKQQRLQQR